MTVSININNLTLCHKASNGISIATIPDVCKTPTPMGPVPIPYPNIAMSSDLMKGTTTVKADGGNMCANYGSEFFKSTGDEPGVAGGVASSTFIKEATWITFSFDVKLEGKAACRLTDKMFHNHQNTVNMAGELQAPQPGSLSDPLSGCKCNSTPAKIEPTCDAPVSGSPNKGCDYYRKRLDDYKSRHTCPECEAHPPPDYYENYGLKYCERFSTELYPKLSPEGQAWLKRTRCSLQQKLEAGLQNNPEMELDSGTFRDFAFDTHPSAYLESGLAKLPMGDWAKIAATPDFADLATISGISQGLKAGAGVVSELVGDIFNGSGSGGFGGGGGGFSGGGASGSW
jgi:hypothetical protein